MKRIRTTAIIVLVLAAVACAFIVGQTLNGTEPQTQLLTVKLDGQDYVVGSVTDGLQQVDRMAIFSLLLANAEDPGIQRTAQALGFRGPMSIQEIRQQQLQGELPNEP